LFVAHASQAVEKMTCSVILSEAKNLCLFVLSCLNRREILRFAQNDNVLSFSAACLASVGPETRPPPNLKKKRRELPGSSPPPFSFPGKQQTRSVSSLPIETSQIWKN
jgi:hypothetical protein